MTELHKKIKLEDNKKRFAKLKIINEIKLNDNLQQQKAKTERALYEQRRIYEKSLLLQTQKELEDEKKQNLLNKMKESEKNGALIFEAEQIKKEKIRLKQDQKQIDQEYTKEYLDMVEKQEKVKRDKLEQIKEIVKNQPDSLPEEKQKNIFGLTVQQEEKKMFNRMKKDEAEDKTK